MVGKKLRFPDLLNLNIINNRVTLNNWIRDRGFPPGTLIGPNTRVWDEAEVEAWLASRPTAPKPPPPRPERRGRPRKGAIKHQYARKHRTTERGELAGAE